MPALQLAGFRQVIAGLIYVNFFLLRGAKLPKGKEWIPIIILSVLNFTLSNGLSTWGVKYISAGLGSIIGAIFPLWIVIINLFSSRKIPPKAVLGLLLGFAGVCVIFYAHLTDFLNADFRFGIIISIIATWTWAFGTIYTKKQAANFNPYFSLGLQMLISGIGLTALAKFSGNSIAVTDIPWQSWASLAYLITFGSLIAFIAYLYALQRLPTEQVSIYAYVNPAVAVICEWLVFHEKISLFLVIGGIVALFGVNMVNKAFKAMPAPEQPESEGV